ncbi:hypothetical protein [Pontibacillus yanchengensis]|uniref:hypothetical protein n=1 Tax=Pontibacillus yanchengensis TaxID=462910 RepID=UPI00136F2036|nr:hypothetical protein [Pontibacillus yanchengensis]
MAREKENENVEIYFDSDDQLVNRITYNTPKVMGEYIEILGFRAVVMKTLF